MILKGKYNKNTIKIQLNIFILLLNAGFQGLPVSNTRNLPRALDGE